MRLFTTTVYSFFTTLLWLKYVKHISMETVYSDVWRFYKNGGFEGLKEYKFIQNLYNNKSDSSYELLDYLMDRISNEGKQEGDLIDLLVTTLKLPYAGNIMSGKTMDKLKRAMLFSSELAGLEEHLKAQEKGCVSCGHSFEDGEAVVCKKNDKGLSNLYCVNCVNPELVVCSGCNKSTAFSERYGSKKYKNCESHSAQNVLKIAFAGKSNSCIFQNAVPPPQAVRLDPVQAVRMQQEIYANLAQQHQPPPFPNEFVFDEHEDFKIKWNQNEPIPDGDPL